MAIKFCVKCGTKFNATGREVICPSCKAQAAEESKKAAVLKAKRASWSGESVPVRISGRASTVIREFGSVNSMSFAESLDYLLKASNYFKSTGRKWEEVTPYKSRRRDKATSTAQDVQEAASKPQGVQDGTQAAGKPQEVKTSTAKTSVKTAGKKTTGASKAGKKA